MSRLQYKYKNLIIPSLIEKFKINNIKAIPSLHSIIISSSSKLAIQSNSTLFNILVLLEIITGQKPTIVRAKKSIAAFKLKKNTAMGGKVILQKDEMFNFLDKLVYLVLPKIDNFQGIKVINKNSIDIGLKEFSIFPEIEEKADKIRSHYGLNITILFNSSSLEETKILLNYFQFPLFNLNNLNK